MKILIAGSNGMIGPAVASYLASQDHEINRLVRREPVAGEVYWDPDAGTIDATGHPTMPHARRDGRGAHSGQRDYAYQPA